MKKWNLVVILLVLKALTADTFLFNATSLENQPKVSNQDNGTVSACLHSTTDFFENICQDEAKELENISITDGDNNFNTQDRSGLNTFRKVLEEYLNPVINVIAVVCSILTIIVLCRSSLKSSHVSKVYNY